MDQPSCVRASKRLGLGSTEGLYQNAVIPKARSCGGSALLYITGHGLDRGRRALRAINRGLAQRDQRTHLLLGDELMRKTEGGVLIALSEPDIPLALAGGRAQPRPG